MGTKMTPAYANIFMGRLEEQLLKSVALRPFSRLRFIDDIAMKWSHGRETLTAFLDKANNFHPTIKFTAVISTKQHVFLDTKSSLVGETISVDLYTKPKDTHQYLLPTSCHPKHYCKNVPYSLALRLRRICSDSDTFESRASELTDHVCKRGYQKQDISLGIESARQLKRETYFLIGLNPSRTFSPSCWHITQTCQKVRDIVNKHWPIIESSRTLQKDRPWPTEISRICGIFLWAKLKPNMHDDEPLGETRSCGKARCKTCKMITPHRSRSRRLGQQSSLVATLLVRRPVLSTL